MILLLPYITYFFGNNALGNVQERRVYSTYAPIFDEIIFSSCSF